MAGIIDYIHWRGDLSFRTSPFNVVDNLILSILSYIDFEDLAHEGEELGSAMHRYIESAGKMKSGIFLPDEIELLFRTAGNSNRFRFLKLKEFINKIDDEIQLQFSVVVYELNEEEIYVAFRGTDDTLVGWKENFNMSFMNEVPAQIEALAYLEKIIEQQDYKKVYVGGHSKGGNLAVYSAVYLKEKLKPRIEGVFNNDGPGFKNDILTSPKYLEVANRIITLIPQSSVVGLLLVHDEKYRIVKSNKSGIMQHDGFSWEVMSNDFVYLSDLNDNAKIVDMSMKKTLEKMSLEQREAFTNVLFDVLSVKESKTLTELSEGGIGNIFKISENYSNLNEDTRKAINETFSLFFDESLQSYLEVTEINQWKNKLEAWTEETKNEIEAFSFFGIRK